MVEHLGPYLSPLLRRPAMLQVHISHDNNQR
jgi:hypothetical protein